MLASLGKTFELQKRHAGSSYGQYEKGRDRAGAVAQLVEDLSNMHEAPGSGHNTPYIWALWHTCDP